jgi:hypothetical protein
MSIRAGIELAHDGAGDLAQDGQLGDPQRLLEALAPRHLFQLARLGAEPAHLLDHPGHLARVPSSACRRSSARRTTSSRSCARRA